MASWRKILIPRPWPVRTLVRARILPHLSLKQCALEIDWSIDGEKASWKLEGVGRSARGQVDRTADTSRQAEHSRARHQHHSSNSNSNSNSNNNSTSTSMAAIKLKIEYLRHHLRLLCCFGMREDDLVAPMGTDPRVRGKLQKQYVK